MESSILQLQCLPMHRCLADSSESCSWNSGRQPLDFKHINNTFDVEAISTLHSQNLLFDSPWLQWIICGPEKGAVVAMQYDPQPMPSVNST
eukprot:scaffold1525_cov142-Cylindrotheca_fusiformis.AAC.112